MSEMSEMINQEIYHSELFTSRLFTPKRKTNWLFFLNNRGDVNAPEDPPKEEPSFGEAIVKEMEEQEEGAGKTEEKKEAEAAAAKAAETPEIDVEGYKGSNRRAKGYEGDKRRESDKVIEDPEHELDFELEEGKGKHKLKLSELRETAKFLHSNKRSIGSTMKIREMATKNPDFGKLINSVIDRSFGKDEVYNGEFVSKTLASLDAKAEKIDDKIDETDDDIKQAEDLLNSDDIDPDSVQSQVLKNNIAAMKSTKAQLTKALKKIDDVSAKFGDVEKSHQTFITDQGKAEEDKETDRVSNIFTKEFKVITDKSRENAYKFIDDEDRQDFERKVRNIVASESGKKDSTIKTDEDFVKLIKSASESIYKRISGIRESYVNDYIRSKGGKVGDAPKDTAVSEENMKEQLAALEKDGKKDSPEAQKLRAAIKAAEDDPLGGKTIGETIADAMFAEQK